MSATPGFLLISRYTKPSDMTRIITFACMLSTGLLSVAETVKFICPVNSYSVNIIHEGNKTSISPNYNGECTGEFPLDGSYAYYSDFGSGIITEPVIHLNPTFKVTPQHSDETLNGEFRIIPTTHTTTSNASYNLWPTHYIRSYNKDKTIFVGKLNPDLDYRLYDCSTGAFSSKFNPSAVNSEVSVPFYRIKFICKSDNSPLILKNIQVRSVQEIYNSSSNEYNNKTTDGNGTAIFYLMAGEYLYSINGIEKSFSVSGDKDIELNCMTRDFHFVDANGTSLPYVKYNISPSCKMSNLQKNFQTSNADGSFTLHYCDDEQTLSVNSIGYLKIGGSTPSNITLYKITNDLSNVNEGSFVGISDNDGGSFSLSTNESVYLMEGTYSVNVWMSPRNYTTLSLKINSDVSLNTILNLKKVIVKLTENNSKPLAGVQLSAYNGSIYSPTVYTDINGEAEFLLKSGYYEFRQGQTTLGKANILDNQDIIFDLPEEISFNVTLKGKPFSGAISATDDLGIIHTGIATDGIAKMRIPDDQEYFISIGSSPYPSKIYLRAGISLDFVSVRVLSEGNGLAFPLCNYYREMPEQLMLKNDNLHLVAVAGAKSSFHKWTINDVEYTDDVIDYLIDSDITAIAEFSQEYGAVNEITSDSSYDIRISNSIIYFPQRIDADCKLYSINGMLLKSTHAVSDHLDISNLTTGVYLLELQINGERYINKIVL